MAVFPFASVAITVTEFEPTSAQLNVFVLYEIDTEPEQLSVAVAVDAGIFTVPAPFNDNVNVLGAEIAGEIVSTTNTFLDALLELPEASVAVIVIALLPRSAHPNVELLSVTVGVLVQLSVVLDTTSAAVMVADPKAFK